MTCKGFPKWIVLLALSGCIYPAYAMEEQPVLRRATAIGESASSSWLASELTGDIAVCEDLNGFVNAKWMAENPAPSDRSSRSLANQVIERNLTLQREIVEAAAATAEQAKPGSIERKIGLLYQSGLDVDTINKGGFDPIKPKLHAIDQIGSRHNIATYLVASFTNGDQQVFFFTSAADFKDARRQIGSARQAGLGLPNPEYYTAEKYAGTRNDYVSYIARSLQLVGISEVQAQSDAAKVLDFETKLARASMSPADLRDLNNNYNLVTLQQANLLTPHFDWGRFFVAHRLPTNQPFSLSQPNFFAAFDELLADAPLDQWKAYLRFHVIDDASPYLAAEFQDAKFNFYGKKLAGKAEQGPRWKQALDSVNQAMGQALGQLYVAKAFSAGSKAQAEQLTDHIRDALKQRIEQAGWMSEPTRLSAIVKLNKMLAKVGYPDHWRSWDGLQIKPGRYYENMMAAAKYDYWYDIGHIGGQTDRGEWDMNPQTVNAYYSRSTNTINFPAAMLQPPFFYPGGDDAINYGALGAFVGHEVTHGFDDKGRQFDGDGNKASWWADVDEVQFNALAEKLVSQFDAYAPIKAKPDLHVNGRLTLSENIADLGGLSIAYDALHSALRQKGEDPRANIDGFTADQRFFLSYARIWRSSVGDKSAEVLLSADRHAPAFARVDGPTSNMAEFARAFQCKASDAMVRSADRQITIW